MTFVRFYYLFFKKNFLPYFKAKIEQISVVKVIVKITWLILFPSITHTAPISLDKSAIFLEN